MKKKPIGLVGGMGCGKSTALAFFKSQGFDTLNSDAVLHSMYNPDHARFHTLAHMLDNWLGTQFLKDNMISRPVLREKIVGTDLLAESLVKFKPIILAELNDICVRLKNPIVEATLLFEMGLEDYFSPIICVTCPKNMQLARIQARDPYLSPEVIHSRLAVQKSNEYKATHSTYVLSSAQELSHLEAQVIDLANKLKIA